jgi:hypothetical protein
MAERTADGGRARSSAANSGYAFAACGCRGQTDYRGMSYRAARSWSGTTYLPTPPKVGGGSGTGRAGYQVRWSGGSADGQRSTDLAVASSRYQMIAGVCRCRLLARPGSRCSSAG